MVLKYDTVTSKIPTESPSRCRLPHSVDELIEGTSSSTGNPMVTSATETVFDRPISRTIDPGSRCVIAPQSTRHFTDVESISNLRVPTLAIRVGQCQ